MAGYSDPGFDTLALHAGAAPDPTTGARAVPIHRSSGEFFGTLCAIDPLPSRVEAPETLQMMELFADLIGAQLESDERHALSQAALHTALRLPHKIAGVMALSGYLPLADRFATERNAANATTPIFMAHGTQDPVVILKRGEDSRDALAALGHPVQWHTYPMPHSVHPREVADIAAFLKQVLPA